MSRVIKDVVADSQRSSAGSGFSCMIRGIKTGQPVQGETKKIVSCDNKHNSLKGRVQCENVRQKKEGATQKTLYASSKDHSRNVTPLPCAWSVFKAHREDLEIGFVYTFNFKSKQN